MAKKRKGWESGRKAGSIVDEPVGPSGQKSKSKKQKKQSKGKHKR